MTEEHPNIALLKRLDLRNLEAAKDLFAEDVILHYFNPNLPDLEGDYVGMNGISSFFQRVGESRVEPSKSNQFRSPRWR